MRVKAAVAGLLAANSTFWLVAAVLFLAVLYFSAAVYMALQASLGAPLAALLTGAGVLLLALAGAAAIALAVRPPRRAQERLPAPLEQADGVLRPVVGDSAADWIRANPVPTLTGAFAVGALLAFSPSARAVVLRAVAPMALRSAFHTAKKLSDSGGD